MKKFKIRLDTDNDRIIWPRTLPPSYTPTKPIIRQLHERRPKQSVEKDIQRRDLLWKEDERRKQRSPGADLYRLHVPQQFPATNVQNPAPAKKVRKPPETSPSIALLSANAFHHAMKRSENEFFTTSIYEIDRLISNYQTPPDDPANAKLVDDRLPSDYHAYKDVFNKEAALQLPPHRPYDHEIVLTESPPNSYSPLYKQNLEELEATREFVMKQLKHGLIEPSRSPFASPILCTKSKWKTTCLRRL